jgi:hypothetical protein
MVSTTSPSVSRLLRVAVAAAAGSLALAPAAAAGGPDLTLGAAEDAVRSPDLVRAKASMSLLHLAGFRAVRVSSVWVGGQTAPSATELTTLQNVAAAASLSGVRVYLAVYNAAAKTTPLAPESRQQFAAYAAAIVKAVPSIRDVIVGNEPNGNRFWQPQFALDGSDAAAPAYGRLLAETYDALKAVSANVRVLGGALSPRGTDVAGPAGTNSPTAFLRDLGRAYRASGRTKPLMDALSFHPYGQSSSDSPDALHPLAGTIGLADYAKLVALLHTAFDGTAQAGAKLPILYDEYGVETKVPAAKAKLYTGAEPAATKPVDETTQTAFYRRALELVFCQPTVTGLLLRHAQDEAALGGSQSGLLYPDGTPKTSLSPVRSAFVAARGGSVARCPGLALPVRLRVLRFPFGSGLKRSALSFRVRCELDCVYRARLVRVEDGATVAATTGRAAAGALVRTYLPKRKPTPGRYRLVLTLSHPVNPGAPLVRESAPFRLPA